MIKKVLAASLLCTLVSCMTAGPDPSARRVATVGDSVTYGHEIAGRRHNSYPAQLSMMLGEEWHVANFGNSGTTLLQSGDDPYTKTRQYHRALQYDPDILIIMLGTNDSQPQNWKHSSDFESDYIKLIESFKQGPHPPRVYICTPVPAYSDKWGIRDPVIRTEIIPAIFKIASQTEVTVIDMYTPLTDKHNLFPDTIHPNEDGARIIAETVYQHITH